MNGLQPYDVIGDIHGHASKLWELLEQLGYKKQGGIYRHPSRQVLFLGDFIDRGPQQLAVLETVRDMVENGQARSVMGNHEFNAIGWMSHDSQGRVLRQHSSKNYDQHKAFLDAVGEGSAAHREWIGWFKTLPLWMELPELQIVHACWSPDAMECLDPLLDEGQRLKDAHLATLFERGSAPYTAVEVLLKGPEVTLPDGHVFHDKDNHPRQEARIKWWLDSGTLRDTALLPASIAAQLPEHCMQAELSLYPNGAKPTFIGHYWMRGKPLPLNHNTACLDFSVAKDGQLVAYRFDGEKRLRDDKFVAV
ncbi:MAG: metallophosphoesterase [Pseudomonas profundi]|uniref:metallophosphoesterase n=1 Tax=Pseudomonas profundi TaxID=1981513 RepID=UPI003001EA4D